MASIFGFHDYIDPLADTVLPGAFPSVTRVPHMFVPGSQEGSRRRVSDTSPTGAPAGTLGRSPNVIGSAGWTRSIPVDFISREKVYVVRADIPGVRKSDIHVDTHDGNVLRFGHNPDPERAVEDEEEEGVFLRAERVSTFRNRNLRMPDDADLEGDIIAKYHDGVLEITIPKKQIQHTSSVRQIKLQ